jgi:hypothetical protein
MRLASCVALAIVSSACWSLTTSVPEVTGGRGDDSDSGAGTDAEAPIDGAIDAATDTSAVGDDSGEGGGPYCATAGAGAFLCDAFDNGTYASGWSTTAQAMGVSFSFANGTFISSARPTCAGGYGQLINVVPKKTANMRLAFDLRAQTLPGNAFNHIIGTEVRLPSGGYYRLDLAISSNLLDLVENISGTGTSHGSTPISFASSRRVELFIDYLGKNASVKVDGTGVIATTIQSPEPSTEQTRIELGIYAGAPCPGDVDLVYDNFTYFRTDR